MVRQIEGMNNGRYLDADIADGERSNFCIGIAGYPEKHFEAPNFQYDLEYTRQKVEAGADFIVTQMFFDNQKYFDYVEACRSAGINVPIVPGLKPLTRKYQLNSIPRKFHVDFPEELVLEMQKASGKEAIRQVGIEWCAAQSRELRDAGVPCLHYYTMGDADTIRRVAEQVF